MATQREVLAHRMPDEAIVREQTAQIRVALKQDAKKIKCFSFRFIYRNTICKVKWKIYNFFIFYYFILF